MVEIINNLFVGNQNDYEMNKNNDNSWFFIHACKEPYHRAALGYKGKGAPKDHPEYLIAVRNNHLILNLVDADDYNYIPMEVINRTLKEIKIAIDSNKKVLLHCNRGESRSPVIGLLFLSSIGFFEQKEFMESERMFKKIYTSYNPATGMRDFALKNWHYYQNKHFINQ